LARPTCRTPPERNPAAFAPWLESSGAWVQVRFLFDVVVQTTAFVEGRRIPNYLVAGRQIRGLDVMFFGFVFTAGSIEREGQVGMRFCQAGIRDDRPAESLFGACE